MEWNIRTFGVLVIGIILLAIVIAFIFSAKFRKDVIAGEGEAAVLGLINVKGVIIVLLTGVFGGIFVYLIVKSDAGNSGAAPTLAEAIQIIKEDESESSKVRLEKDSSNAICVYIGGVQIGSQRMANNNSLNLKKNRNETLVWNIIGNEEFSKSIKIPRNNHFVAFRSGSGDSHSDTSSQDRPGRDEGDSRVLEFGKPVYFQSSTFVLRVDSVFQVGYDPDEYLVQFGEYNEELDTTIWKTNYGNSRIQNMIKKTDHGRIYKEDQFQFIMDATWKKAYFVGIGLGAPSHPEFPENAPMDHVDLANIMVFDIGLVPGEN